mgnify:CR=1 FL=1
MDLIGRQKKSILIQHVLLFKEPHGLCLPGQSLQIRNCCTFWFLVSKFGFLLRLLLGLLLSLLDSDIANPFLSVEHLFVLGS